ncbi:glutamyl-tRNA reductase [Alcanivorax quisquiliarum]|uniref:Glutamyl-tRNA reductase n=1 Tax=Alcanivorax quisquiliarum TaxID=2933565 RepID=A0ABT0E9Y2_9GAMM|nr:glutamyl-tRNA reductase [Alcanivorax quisquiliarum]MCK0538631.1 glutamyl-tRNA reductase [Alcanivorax quisquiliarum]
MKLLATGVNHTTAELSFRERLTFPETAIAAALQDLRRQPGVAEAALLSTCNRTEIYCLAHGPAPDLTQWLADWHGLDGVRLREALYRYEDEEALRHMMRVAGGLDSLVLGEPQILGQMREAYARATDAGALTGELARAFQQVFSVAKRIRTDTGIGANPVSVAYAAVSFARHIFADLKKSRALLIGAGEMIELVTRHLSEQGVGHITVANRTLPRAQALAAQVGGEAVSLAGVPAALERTDIVIACTGSPVPVLGKGVVERALKKRRHKPIFMVDIAVPRDIEPEVGRLQDVYLYTVDDLHEAIEENVRQRQEAARHAEQIINAALDRHERERRELAAVDTLRSYREQTLALGEDELRRSLTQLESGADPAEVLRRFQHALLNKVMHGPSVQLRRLAAENRTDDLLLARQLLLRDDSEE